jgi:hypothetical protein
MPESVVDQRPALAIAFHPAKSFGGEIDQALRLLSVYVGHDRYPS